MKSVLVPLIADVATSQVQGGLTEKSGEEAGKSAAAGKAHADGSNGHAIPPVVALTTNCYQCGKCTAGCPVADRMDLAPNVVFRLVQLGQLDRAIHCGAIWHCVSCFTCATRCPQSVDCVAIMDSLRMMAVEEGAVPAEQQAIVLFQQAFLNNIRKYGRLNEVQLIAQFKKSTFFNDFNFSRLFEGASMGPKMREKHKLHLKGEAVKDRGILNRIFERCTNESNGHGPKEGHSV